MFAVAGAMAFSGAVGVAGTAKADSSELQRVIMARRESQIQIIHCSYMEIIIR